MIEKLAAEAVKNKVQEVVKESLEKQLESNDFEIDELGNIRFKD